MSIDIRASLSASPSIDIGFIEKVPAFREAVLNLRGLLDKEKDLTIILDEVDKERKDELIKVIDNIKYAFEGENTTLLVALPPIIYKEYLLSKASVREVSNLENIFAYMVNLKPLEDKALVEILERRLGNYLRYVEEEAINWALRFASGNPRQFLSVLREATIFAKEKIEGSKVKAIVENYVRLYLLSLNLSQKEKALLLQYSPEWEEFLKNVKSARIFSNDTAIYTYLSRMETKGILRKEGKRIKLNPRIKLALNLGILE